MFPLQCSKPKVPVVPNNRITVAQKNQWAPQPELAKSNSSSNRRDKKKSASNRHNKNTHQQQQQQMNSVGSAKSDNFYYNSNNIKNNKNKNNLVHFNNTYNNNNSSNNNSHSNKTLQMSTTTSATGYNSNINGGASIDLGEHNHFFNTPLHQEQPYDPFGVHFNATSTSATIQQPQQQPPQIDSNNHYSYTTNRINNDYNEDDFFKQPEPTLTPEKQQLPPPPSQEPIATPEDEVGTGGSGLSKLEELYYYEQKLKMQQLCEDAVKLKAEMAAEAAAEAAAAAAAVQEQPNTDTVNMNETNNQLLSSQPSGNVNTNHNPNDMSLSSLESSLSTANDDAGNAENETPVPESQEQKLLVPKLKLLIPKHFQKLESEDEEESGEEEEEEVEEEEGEEEEEEEGEAEEEEVESETEPVKDDRVEPVVENQEVEENEIAVENPPELHHDDTVLGEEPMDIEEDLPQRPLEVIEEKPQPPSLEEPPILPPDEPEKMEEEEDLLPKLPSGCQVAGEDIQILELQLQQGLDHIPIRDFMKTCLGKSFPYCLYCNHARKIAVNGYGLALHFIQNHRFHAIVDSITAEELHPEKIVNKFRQHFEELEGVAFNLDTFDSSEPDQNQTVPYEKRYECFQCRFQAPIHKELYLHNRKTHHKNIVFCMMCKINFYSYSELVSHICPGIPNKVIILGEYCASVLKAISI
jgi:hypothetical protein